MLSGSFKNYHVQCFTALPPKWKASPLNGIETYQKKSIQLLKRTALFSLFYLAFTLLSSFELGLAPSTAYAQTNKPVQKSVIIDRAYFFKQFRKRFYPIKEKEKYLIDRYERLFNYWDSKPQLTDLRWLAYVLATTYHETGRSIKAVRECFGKTDQASINCVTRLYRRGRIKRNYAAIDKKTGKSYFGRGHVQLTWAFNYKRMGKELGMKDKVYVNPDLALHPDTSVAIMSEGMIKGLFTGKRLSQYFNARTTNWGGARRIINGMDKYKLIGGYGRKFHATLRVIPGKPKTDGSTEDPKVATCDGETIPQSCLNKLKSELALLNGKYEDQNKIYLANLSDNKLLADKVRNLTLELETLKSDAPDIAAELASLKNAHQDLENRYKDIQTQNKSNEDEKFRLAELNSKLQTKLDDAIATGSTGTDGGLLKTRLEELEAKQKTLETKLAAVSESQQKLAKLSESLSKKQSLLEDKEQDIEISRSALQTREKHLLEDQDAIEKEENRLTEANLDLNHKEARLKQYEKDLAAEKAKLEEYYSKSWFSRAWDKTSSMWSDEEK